MILSNKARKQALEARKASCRKCFHCFIRLLHSLFGVLNLDLGLKMEMTGFFRGNVPRLVGYFASSTACISGTNFLRCSHEPERSTLSPQWQPGGIQQLSSSFSGSRSTNAS